MGAQEIFVQNVKAGNWVPAVDQLNGSPMYDILPFLAALGPDTAIAANNISGILRKRGWYGAAQRIEWAGEILRTRRIPNPPPGLPADQVTDAQSFLVRTAKTDLPSAAPGGGRTITTAQLRTQAGTLGWVGWSGASPAVQALARQLEAASGGTLSRNNTRLQGAGHIDAIDEHYSGLSVDIMLNSANDDQKRQAHNLIRFFVTNRAAMGWLHMYYQNWGFGQQGKTDPSPGHHDHVHIDWFDGRLAVPSGYGSTARETRTSITWPDVAMKNTWLSSSEVLEGLRGAWNSTVAPFDDIDGLYQ